MVQPFLDWLERERPHVRRFDDLSVDVVRDYRGYLSTRTRRDGRPLQPETIFDSHRALLTLFRWASAEGYATDPRILALKRPRVPDKEPTVYHARQVRTILVGLFRSRQ